MKKIQEVKWLASVREKIQTRHGVETDEVEWVLGHHPHVRFCERGRVRGEDLYAAYGQTEAGRYLVVFFILKPSAVALPITARLMTSKERRLYARQKKTKD